MFGIAGLWRTDPKVGEACTMLTVEPGPDVAPYHNRQVAVIGRTDWSVARCERAGGDAAAAVPGGDVRGRPRLERQLQLERLVFALAFAEVRQGQAEQADALGERHQRAEQGAADVEEFLAAGDGAVEALARVTIWKSRILDLQGDRPAADLLLGDPAPDGVADLVELGDEGRLLDQILDERVLGADRLVGPVGLDLAVADAAGEVVIIFGRAAEMVGAGRRGSGRAGRRR